MAKSRAETSGWATEEALRQSQDLFRDFAECSTNWFWEMDAEFRFIYVSPNVRNILGVPPEWYQGKTSEEVLDKSFDHEGWQEHLQILNEHKSFRDFVCLRTARGNEPRWFSTSGNPVFGADGAFQGYRGTGQEVTARVHAEDELLRSEERYRNLVEGSIQGVVVHRNFKLLFVNGAYASIFGYDTPEELLEIGDHRVIIAPHERKRLQRYHQARLRGGKAPSRYEFQGVRKDGELIRLENIARPVIWDGLPAVQATISDITEREKAEQALHANERLLQEVLNALPHWITVQDLQGNYRLVNAAITEAYQSSQEEFLSHNMENSPLSGWEKVRLVEQYNQTVCKTGETLEVPQYDVRLPGGKENVRRLLKIPLFSEDGEVSGIVSWSEDITGRKRAEEALRESEEKFRTTVDHSPSAIFLKDLDGRYRMINRRFETMYGISAADAIGKTSHDFFPEKDADRFAAQDRNVLETQQFTEHEFDVPLSGGALRRVISIKYPVFDGAGQAVGVGTIATDVNEQRRAEQHLRETQKMEAVGQLAGGIAHDFNNLLQVIISYTHLIRANLHNPETLPQYLDTVLKASGKATSLTRQLLALGRKGLIQKKPLDLNELTSDLMKMLGRLIGENIELDVRQGADLHRVEADPGMMEQVLLNLCVNARDAMPGGGQLIIETKNFLADQEFCNLNGWKRPGPYVMVSVSDSGEGMPPEIRERMFEPFFTTKETGKGTGLGLAMVYGIVQQHNGIIDVYSEPSTGTTFKIYLPETSSIDVARGDPLAAEAPGGSETILVAEDDEAVRTLIARLLESNGYAVLTATNGAEALDALAKPEHAINLVLLDVVMPKLGGRQVYEKINEINPSVRVVFSSGYASNVLDVEFMTENNLRFLAKPYSPNTLLKTVREAIDQPQP